MVNLTSLLAQAPLDHEGRTETLADTLRKHARDLTEADLLVLVTGLREQRTRWNAVQAAGSKERVSSKKIAVQAMPVKRFALKVPPKPVL